MNLNDEQRTAVEHGEGPLLVVAGAGTGKTRVIIERIGYLLTHIPRLQPENILALTFSKKAAEEMRLRTYEKEFVDRFGGRAQRCRFSTFHAFCYDLLREDLPLRALDKFDQWIFFRRHLEELEPDYYLKLAEPGRFLEELVDFCSRCHDNLVSPADYRRYVEKLAAEREPLPPEENPRGKDARQEIARLQEVARVYERSEDLQAREGLLTFGAMISRAVARLKESPAWLRRLQQRYRYILVDEFQDTNAAQLELVCLLAGERGNVTVVGDDDQAIYRFRGASYASFDLFKERFPRHRPVVLDQNYRSTKSILGVAGASIAFNSQDRYFPDKKLKTQQTHDCRVAVQEFADPEQHAHWVAAEIARRMESGETERYSDFAVLYRKHNLRDPLVAALRQRGIPFSIRGLAVNDLPPVRDLLAYLRAIGQPEDSISLARVLADPQWKLEPRQLLEYCRAAGHGRTSLRAVVEDEKRAGWPGRLRLLELLGRYRRMSEQERVCAWLEALRAELGLGGVPSEAPALRAFSEFVAQWDREKCATGLLAEFLEYFAYFEEAGGTVSLPEEESGEPHEAAQFHLHAQEAVVAEQQELWENAAKEATLGKVQLLTVHAAKGLEFEHVFLFHLVQRAFPVSKRQPLISLPAALWKGPLPKGDFHVEEERRLFYVGLTRARRQLTLCTISTERQRPSRFLQELKDANCPDLVWTRVPLPEMPPPRQPLAEDSTTTPTGSRIAAWAGEAAPPATEHFWLTISQLQTYLDCPLKYQFSYGWRIPVAPAPPLVFGSVMHGAVKEVVRALAQAPGTLSPEFLEATLNRHWPAAGFADPLQDRKYREEGLRQLEAVRQVWSQEPFELLYQEKSFEFEWGGTTLLGRVDQINRCSASEVELIEYKTGRPQTQKEADGSDQLTLYAEACRRVFGLAPRRLILFNLTTGERVGTTRTREQFQELEQTIRQTAAAIRAGQFPPQPGFLCRYCDFRPICPAHEEAEWRQAVPVQRKYERD